MLKIRVRVWDTEDKVMLYNAQDTYDYMGTVMEDSFKTVLEKDTYIKMLCSDMTDSKGVYIYNGDILRVSHLNGKFDGEYIVIYKNGKFIIEEPFEFDLCTLIEYKNVEVIGNIYETERCYERV